MAGTTIEDERHYYAFDDMAYLRSRFAKDDQLIQVTDLGVGSQVSNQKQRTVSSIHKSAVSGIKKSELLFRIGLSIKPKSILELGTSLGVSSRYMHHAAPEASLTTVEGCPNIFAVAQKHLSKLSNISQIQSDFDSFIHRDIQQDTSYDLIYIDGNHQYEATLRYANQLREKLSSHSIMIFDDIYWSSGMSKAWQQIKEQQIFDATLDYYQFGLGIVNKEIQTYQDIMVRPTISRLLKMIK